MSSVFIAKHRKHRLLFLNADGEGGDPAAAEFVDQGDDFAVRGVAIGSDRDRLAAGSSTSDGGGQLLRVKWLAVEVDLGIGSNDEGGRVASPTVGGARLRQVNIDAAVVDVAGGDHEDYQQHQHYIHEGGDVDPSYLVLVKIFQCSHGHQLHLCVRF